MKSTVLMNCIAASVNKISPARSTPLPSGKAGSAAGIGAKVLLAFKAGGAAGIYSIFAQPADVR
jgi:hypothetical protein